MKGMGENIETLSILYALLNIFMNIRWIVLRLLECEEHICSHNFCRKLYHGGN